MTSPFSSGIFQSATGTFRFWCSLREWSHDSRVPLRKRNREKRASTSWRALRPNLSLAQTEKNRASNPRRWWLKTKDHRHLAILLFIANSQMCDFWPIHRWFPAGFRGPTPKSRWDPSAMTKVAPFRSGSRDHDGWFNQHVRLLTTYLWLNLQCMFILWNPYKVVPHS